jgi:hypothetical protein
MHALTLTGWENFFIASAGAAAAIAGLLFVALSINLSRILSIPGLAGRAGETFIPLGVVLIISLHGLVPAESIRTFAVELTVVGGASWLFVTGMEYRAFRARHFLRFFHLTTRIGINQPATLTVPLAGLSILCGFPGGLYWLVPAVGFSFAGALVNAWVLLVEILR